MTPDLAQRIVVLGRLGHSTDMIKRIISKETGKAPPRAYHVHALLRSHGIGDDRDARSESIEMQEYTDPAVLRKRWAKLIEPMKVKLRASIGGI